jgi:predicted ArsR family transcriptional regulator
MNAVAMEHRFWHLFVNTQGGKNRARIVTALKTSPASTNQLATGLKLDYKSVQKHLALLMQEQLVESHGAFNAAYFLSATMQEHWELFERIQKEVEQKNG